MSAAERVVAFVGGVEWTEGDIAARERVMRETPDRLDAFRALDPAHVAARIEREGEAQVAIELGVRVSTLRGEAPVERKPKPRVLASSSTVVARTPRTPRTPRMLPIADGDRHACVHESACLTEIARVYPNAPGASCAPTCAHLQPVNARAERDTYAAARSGDGHAF